MSVPSSSHLPSESASPPRPEIPAAIDPAAETAALARVALEHGDVENALHGARAALGVNPASREALLVMAEVAMRAKNFPLAQKLLLDVSRRNPADPRARQLARRAAARQLALRTTPAATTLSGPAPKHILLYTDDPGRGGVAQYNHALLIALVTEDYFVTCVQTQMDTPLVREQRERGIRHRWLDYDTGLEFARTQTDSTRAKAIFEAKRPDLIVFSDCCPFSNMAARDAAMHLGIPYIVVVGFVGAYLANDFPGVLDMLLPQHAWARAVIAVSEENLRLLHARFGTLPATSRVIYYGRPARFFAPVSTATRARLRAELNLPHDAVVCFTAARLTAIKGFGIQLEALKTLRRGGLAKKLYLVWAGEGDEKEKLAREINQAGLDEHVRLLGQRWDVADWFDAADIFCLPSFVEGMPLAIMEAMAKGLPVIATAVSGIPEELGDAGKLLPDPSVDLAGTVQGLVDTLQAWVQDTTVRQTHGKKCRKRAVEMFREEAMTTATLRLIKDTIAARDFVAPRRNGAEWLSAPAARDQAEHAKFFLRLGHEAKALAAASSALSEDPGLVDALLVMAKLALSHDGGSQAEQMFRQALQVLPEDSEIEAGLAQALIMQGKLGEAQARVNAGLRRAPKEPALLACLARLRERDAALAVAGPA